MSICGDVQAVAGCGPEQLELTCASKELDLGVFRGPCQPQLISAVGWCSCEVAVSSSQGVAHGLHE